MNKTKQKLFENSTKQLLQTIDSMGLDKLQRMQVKNLTLLFRDSFKLPDVKQKTFGIGNGAQQFPYDSYAFCKASSLAHMHILGEDDWQLMYIDAFIHHHYIQHKKSCVHDRQTLRILRC